ncbi:MAG: hypothetical protein C5B50_18100 [Verrucomicrobia bacterium]|nr:MAG: hypothetical protein C5B50_18100 [Verrucomicrobiota bacterium]
MPTKDSCVDAYIEQAAGFTETARNLRALLSLGAALLMMLGGNCSIQAAENPTPQAHAFNIESATRAYLDRMPPDK